MLRLTEIRDCFPALRRHIGGKPIVYLDSAATSLKPQCVIDAISQCYEQGLGNIGRGVHRLAEDATERFEQSRRVVADFINADPDEIVFTKNSTDSINLIASGLPRGTDVLLGMGEHHSNLLPWLRNHRCTECGLRSDGTIDVEGWIANLRKQQSNNALCVFSHISNVSGAVFPIDEVVSEARATGCSVFIDASQSVGHVPVDVQRLGCDFICFSGHKIGGPTGVGVLFIRRNVADRIEPSRLGGGMVTNVANAKYELADLPHRFEAGTPALEAAVGLAAACQHLDAIGLDEIERHERQLTVAATEGLESIKRVQVLGPSRNQPRGPIVAFHVDGVEAHGVARLLSSRFNVMVRSGFHCAQPMHHSLGWRPTVRASFAHFNTIQDVQALLSAVRIITG